MMPRGGPWLGHVASNHKPKKWHVSKHDSPNCQPIKNCHITSATSVYRLCHVSLYTLYGLHSQCPFFCLFDYSNRSQYISLSTSIWTQTSCVWFVTMRPTLSFNLNRFWALWIFEQNLIPWSHLPIGKLLDLQKTIFSLCEDEGIVPSPFQPQSTWLCLDWYL